jgi:hypothetical protein
MSWTGFIPNAAQYLLPEQRFDAMISAIGQRVSWMRSHSCPCTFSQTTQLNRLATTGSAQRSCVRCLGLGTYWDPPTIPFIGYVSFTHQAASPDEPGVIMNNTLGPVQSADPMLTIPYQNPNLGPFDPGQPTEAWQFASTDDAFVVPDMLARFTAVLQVAGLTNLPFQQNLQIAPTGAVTVWNQTTLNVDHVDNYSVSGPTVTIYGYPNGTNYMVEFIAAPLYLVWNRSGGLPHTRPFGGGRPINEPRRFKLQVMDLWMRQRGIQPSAPGSAALSGSAVPYVVPVMTGMVAR